MPVPDVFTCIERDAGLREPVIRLGTVGLSVCRKGPAQPAGVADRSDGRAVEPHLGFSAAQVGETVLSEIPEQKGYLVFTLLQVRSQFYHVEITAVRIGTSLQLSFEYCQFTIDPKPVLAVYGYPGRGGGWYLVQCQILPESDPLVGRT